MGIWRRWTSCIGGTTTSRRMWRSRRGWGRSRLANGNDDAVRFEPHIAKWEWQYDNHGNYDGESWSWYYSPRYHFERGQNIILARLDETGVVVAVHFDDTSPH